MNAQQVCVCVHTPMFENLKLCLWQAVKFVNNRQHFIYSTARKAFHWYLGTVCWKRVLLNGIDVEIDENKNRYVRYRWGQTVYFSSLFQTSLPVDYSSAQNDQSCQVQGNKTNK